MPNSKLALITDGSPAESGDEIYVNRGGLDRRVAVGGVWPIDDYIEFTETTAPAAGAATTTRMFTRDNGSGKTQLCVLYDDGSVGVLHTQE